jgi:ADP-ribose pyrophosphatase YjhB (NUDIX family)
MKHPLHVIWRRLPRFLRTLIVWIREDRLLVSVVAVIFDEEGRIFLLDHEFRTGASWGCPGGFVEAGEDPEEALARELREELSVELVEAELALVRRPPGRRQIEIVYQCRIAGAVRLDAFEARDWNWFPFDELPAISSDQKDLIEWARTRWNAG